MDATVAAEAHLHILAADAAIDNILRFARNGFSAVDAAFTQHLPHLRCRYVPARQK